MSKEEIITLRKHLKCSQAVFARALNVSLRTIQAWEQGLREPSDVALKLLSIASKRPEVLFE
jgi:putative transcriptional regulator